MKKITGFFLALLPIFVLVLLFISGLLIKNYTHVWVTSVEFASSQNLIKMETDEQDKYKIDLDANVLPHNATNPEVYYRSSDPEIVKVDDNGVCTAQQFGTASIYAFSKENETINAKCEVEVYDDKIHFIDVKDQFQGEYIGLNHTVNLNAVPVPSTRLKQDPTLTYALKNPDDKTFIDLSPNGDITCINSACEHPIPITITTTPVPGKDEPIIKEVEVKVGRGVNVIDFKHPENQVTFNTHYNIYNDIIFYPEDNPDKVPPTDFEYELVTPSNDDDIATVDENGLITFKQAGTVIAKVSYKRGENVLQKSITCTNDGFIDVAFNRYSYEKTLTELPVGSYIPTEDVNWDTFPKTNDVNKYDIKSNNENVIIPEKNNDGWKLKVAGAGKAIITISALSIDHKTDKQDSIFINITDDFSIEGLIKQQSVSAPADHYYYYLRDNINIDKLPDPHEKITWELDSTGREYADVSDVDDMLRFKRSATDGVIVTVKIGDKTVGTFRVICNVGSVETISIAQGDHVQLEAGKRYKFISKSGSYELAPPQSLIDNKTFYFVDAGSILSPDRSYISVHGYNNPDFEYYYYDELIPWDTLAASTTITEAPIDLYYKPENMVYVSSASTINFNDVVSYVPRQVMNADGTIPQLDVQFTPDKPDLFIKSDDGTMTFKEAGYVQADVTYNGKLYEFAIIDTYNQAGKFYLKNQSGEAIYSGASIDLSPEGMSLLLDKNTVFQQQFIITDPEQQFKITKLNGNNKLDVTMSLEGTTEQPQVKFNLKPKEGVYGSETLIIQSGNFRFLLNINFEDSINSIGVLYKGKTLINDNDNTTYVFTDKLLLDIEIKPISIISDIKDNVKAEITDGTVTSELPVSEELSVNLEEFISSHKEDGKTFTLTISVDGYIATQKIKLIYKDPTQITDFDVVGAIKPKEEGEPSILPITCGATFFVFGLVPGGLADQNVIIDKTFYFDDQSQSRFTYEKPDGIHVNDPNSLGLVYATNVPAPKDEDFGRYENSFKIIFKPGTGASQVTKELKLSREIVSRIKFPGHDNNEIADQRGLQKVHVYGNTSMYSPEEGVVDYYKLPLEMYDFNGNVIKNTTEHPNAVKECFETLEDDVNHVEWMTVVTPNIESTAEKVVQMDYLEVHFHATQNSTPLLTQQEVYDNLFADPVNNKNLHYSLSTRSGLSKAEYTFVAVDGINAYCQEGLAEGNDVKGIAISHNKVLQTNFGLEGATQDNAPLTDSNIYQLYTIYGNGYTMLFEARQKLRTDEITEWPIQTQYAINTTIQGCLDTEIPQAAVSIKPKGGAHEDDPNNLMAYCTIKNTQFGINGWYFRAATRYNIKNTIFYNNAISSLIANADDSGVGNADMYVEKSVFFNCSATALLVAKQGRMFLKDFVDVYNFKGKEILDLRQTYVGLDLRQLWGLLVDVAKEQDMIQISSSGETRINSCCISTNPDSILFWNGSEYVASDQGFPTAGRFIKKFIELPEIEKLKIAVWATPNPEHNPGAPSYYDQFDGDGNVNWQFLNNQIVKVIRQWAPLPYSE